MEMSTIEICQLKNFSSTLRILLYLKKKTTNISFLTKSRIFEFYSIQIYGTKNFYFKIFNK